MSLKVKPGVPIEARGGSFLTRSYVQDGTTIAYGSILSELAKNPKSASMGSKANTLFWLSNIPAGFGGYAIGTSLWGFNVSSEERKKMLLGGVGLIGLSLLAVFYADDYANEAIELYNSSTGKKESKIQSPKTQISLLDSGRGLGFSLDWIF